MSDESAKREFMEFAYDFHLTMRQKQLILAYEGEVNQQLTKAFASLAEQKLEKDQEDNNVRKKVFHVMVECLQNLGKHADHIDDSISHDTGAGIILVGANEKSYIVTTGNMISVDKIKWLNDTLEMLNGMTRDEVKQLYKTRLKESRLSEKAGAGLGLIDMVKKTGQKVDYHFIPVSEKSSFFLFKVKIAKSN
jgi:hypothetical protein